MICGDAEVYRAQKSVAVGRLDQPAGTGAVDKRVRLVGADTQRRSDVVGTEVRAQRRHQQGVEHRFVQPAEAFDQCELRRLHDGGRRSFAVGRSRGGDRRPKQEGQARCRDHQRPNDFGCRCGAEGFGRVGRPPAGSVRPSDTTGFSRSSAVASARRAGRCANGSAATTTVDAGSVTRSARLPSSSSSSRCASSMTTAASGSSSRAAVW